MNLQIRNDEPGPICMFIRAPRLWLQQYHRSSMRLLPQSDDGGGGYLNQTGAGDVLDAFPLDHVKDYDGRLTEVR